MSGAVRRVAIGVGALVLAVALGTAGFFAAWAAGIRIPFASGTTYMRIEKLAGARYAGETSDTVWMLLVGSDYRPGVGGARGDALHVAVVNPRLGQGTILNIPRDTCASVPGYGFTKINAGHAAGGPRVQADVVGALIGHPIAYAISVDFAGFTSLVDGVGGVTVDVPSPMDDVYSGAVFSPGPTRMNGGQALAFSRDRHDFPTGDIQRSWNQGHLILSALRQLQQEARDVAGQFRLLALLGRHAQIDGLGFSELYRLGRIAAAVDPAAIKNVTLPVGGGGCAGGLAPTSAAVSLLADLRDDGVLQAH